MKWTLTLLVALLLLAVPAMAQDATSTTDTVTYAFTFPITMPGDTQILEAAGCDLNAIASDSAVEATRPPKPSACELALQAVSLAAGRGEDSNPSEEELALLTKVIGANSALPFDLEMLRWYFGAMPLVSPPAFASQPITEVHIIYSFSGLGSSAYYSIDITHADQEPVVSGNGGVNNSFSDGGETAQPTQAPQILSGTVDEETVQAFGPALRDLLPIGRQFTSTPCWDYYPNWVVDLSFADGSEVKMVTNQSNVVGIGGPWQTEIDGQNYMQYSAAFSQVIIDLFAALDLEFGQTAAMGCGGMNNPLVDAFPAPPIVN